MNQINDAYPTELRELAEIHELPTPVYQALYLAAQNFEYMLNALKAAQPEIEKGEAMVTVRFFVPDKGRDADVASVSVSAGETVDPNSPLLMLAAHDAIVACARSMNGAPNDNDICDESVN